ncbi:2'-5' RNA ligase family protein [Hymenobacter metallilatus]|uniref:2'-5' RNA ligase family protein n=1 Tax=Hymenobacter metallilatus TaxID=2493666 RepID=A0A428JLT3_9BACT|nr:2'-5' RNA ligase family protein [Hymenobacter metallilatus]RSK34024.1 2'-5' RNA ligase family protein [Hymenobacter metallilatus]
MTLPDPAAPLILTLTLNPEAQQHFTHLRRLHFPPSRNYLEAHVTLFHHLPGAELAAVHHTLKELAATVPVLPLHLSGVRFLGNGVAYSLDSPPLLQLHRALQSTWAEWLTPQDRQPLRPHITVQNKVAPAVAKALHEQLQRDFEPQVLQGTGITVWAYRGGPWQQLAQVPFTGAEYPAGATYAP